MNIALEPNGKLVSIELTIKDMQQIYNEDNWYIYFHQIDKFMEEVKKRYASNVCSETDRQRS